MPKDKPVFQIEVMGSHKDYTQITEGHGLPEMRILTWRLEKK